MAPQPTDRQPIPSSQPNSISGSSQHSEELLRPAKFGGNKESVQYLEKRQIQQLASVEDRLDQQDAKIADLSTAITKMSALLSDFLELQKPAMQKPVKLADSPPPEAFYRLDEHFDGLNDEETPEKNQPFHNPSTRQPKQSSSPSPKWPSLNNESSKPINTTQIKIRRRDIGTFDPAALDPKGQGIITEGGEVVFTDVTCFEERLRTFAESGTTLGPGMAGEAECQILAIFQTLLAGPAILWWNNELTSDGRRALRTQGLEAVLQALRQRFALDPAMATMEFTKAKLTLSDLADDVNAITDFVQKKLRLARAMGSLGPDEANVFGALTTIWTSMDLDIRHYLRPPHREETLAQYTRQIEESKSVLVASATKLHSTNDRSPDFSSEDERRRYVKTSERHNRHRRRRLSREAERKPYYSP